LADGMQKFDQIDFHLIEMLEGDGRLTNAALGAAVGLTEGAVRRRVNNLINSGAMRIVGVSRAEIHGFAQHCMVCLNVNFADVERVVEELATMPELRFVYETVGRFNVIAVGFFADNDGFHNFLTKKLAPVPGIVNLETQVILSTAKRDFGLVGKMRPGARRSSERATGATDGN